MNSVNNKRDNAISHGLGILILVAITIVLVIAVATFGIGFFDSKTDSIVADLTYVQTTGTGDLQYQMESGNPFSLDKLTVTYTLRNYPDYITTLSLPAKALSPGSRFTAGNLYQLEEDEVFQTALNSGNKLYLNFVFTDSSRGTIISSGSIPLHINSYE